MYISSPRAASLFSARRASTLVAAFALALVLLLGRSGGLAHAGVVCTDDDDSSCTNFASIKAIATNEGATPASSVKESVEQASGQAPSISWQPCNVPGKGLVWERAQSITGRLLNC